MGTQAVGWKPRRREEIVSLARDGKITPDDAEAEAAAKGWEPFEREPDLPAFDPLLESRWSIVMALAWIAWRDIGRVRAYCSGFQSQSKHWVRREWNARTEDGSSTPPRAGWVLESWPEPTTSRLWLHEQDLKKNDRLPLTAQMSVLEAEQVLWKALADGHLVGEAIDQNATPIDVPQREWSYLKHFEERERDVVKYHPNDPRPAFRDIKLKRNELMQLWPAAADNPVVSEPSTLIEPMMLEPMVRAPAAGYVPLCVALHWIMTRGGTRNVHVDDADAWGAAVGELHSLICDERVELIGRPRDSSLTRQFPGHSFSLVKILAPVHRAISELLLSAPAHVDCCCFTSREEWHSSYNDKLYEPGQPGPSWTHLQVRKSAILDRWAKPSGHMQTEGACREWLIEQMQKSRSARPKSKNKFWSDDVRSRFPSLARRQ